tara:strand:+ start:364 stop:540 length:177 start_codon:yes stop_codon:yes gene_type:complete
MWKNLVKAMGDFDEDILETITLLESHGYSYSLSIEERKRFDDAIETLRDLFKNYEDDE